MNKIDRARRFAPDSSSFRWAKVSRAIHRQASAFILIWFCLVSIGYLAFPGAFTSAVTGWLWVGAAFSIAGLAALVREFSRDTAAALATIERRAGYAVVGAAPELSPREMRDLPPDQRTPIGYLIHKPASHFAQATRDLQHAMNGHQIVAFIGSVPDEGATTAALCAVASATQQGLRAIAIDCDLRRRSLTRVLHSDRRSGILQAAREPDNWAECIEEEPETGLHFLPAARLQSVWNNLFDAPGFPVLLEKLREHYDLIALDCPPALMAADGAMIARVADKCIVVMGWDQTPLKALRDTRRAFRRRGPLLPSLYVNRVPNSAPRGRRSAYGRPALAMG
jgi:Mrp family chromosome partitioning ATPase